MVFTTWKVTFTVGNFTVVYRDTGNRYIPSYDIDINFQMCFSYQQSHGKMTHTEKKKKFAQYWLW